MKTLLKYLLSLCVLSVFRRIHSTITLRDVDAMRLADLSGVNTTNNPVWYLDLYDVLHRNGFNDKLEIEYDDAVITVGDEGLYFGCDDAIYGEEETEELS